MARLSAKDRAALPASDFAGPGRSYPVNDKAHAVQAERMVGRGVKAGNITPATAAKIKTKAKAKVNGVYEGSKMDMAQDKRTGVREGSPRDMAMDAAGQANKRNPIANLGAHAHPVGGRPELRTMPMKPMAAMPTPMKPADLLKNSKYYK